MAGQTVKTAGTGGVERLALEVASACARAREAGTAQATLAELGRLLSEHPVLRNDTAEQVWDDQTKSWKGEEHLLVPLVTIYAEQQLNN